MTRTRLLMLGAALAASAPLHLFAERCSGGKTAGPVLRRQPPPRCPSPHLRCGGRVVTLEVRIGREGRAESARVLQWEGHPLLGSAAVEAVAVGDGSQRGSTASRLRSLG